MAWDGSPNSNYTVLSEESVLPGDFKQEIDHLLTSTREVRILVLQGMHYGNQSAALELIRNLRRLGYKGKVKVMCDNAPLPYEVRYELRIDFYGLADPAQLKTAVTGIISARFPQYPAAGMTMAADGSRVTVNLIPAGVHAYEEDAPALATALTSLGATPKKVSVLNPLNQQWTTGQSVPPPVGAATATVRLTLKITSISEISIVAKLDLLEPHRQILDLYQDVEWCNGTQFGPANDQAVLGMMASGEYTLNQPGDPIAQLLGTSCVLTLQPSNWKVNDRYARIGGRNIPLCLPRSATYLTDELPVTGFTELVSTTVGDKPTAAGITALLEVVTVGHVDLMMVYGLHQVRGPLPKNCSATSTTDQRGLGTRYGIRPSGPIRTHRQLERA
jgi:hypothetical protein